MFVLNLQNSSDDDGLSKSLLLLKSFSKTLSSPSPRGPIFYGKSKLHLSLQIKKRAKIQKVVDFFVSTIPIRKSPNRFCTRAQKEKNENSHIFSLQNGYPIGSKGDQKQGMIIWIVDMAQNHIFSTFYWILQGKRVAQWIEVRIYSDGQAKVWTPVETFWFSQSQPHF